MNFGYLFTYLVLSSRHELFVVSLVTSKPTSVGKKVESQLPGVVTAWKERGGRENQEIAKKLPDEISGCEGSRFMWAAGEPVDLSTMPIETTRRCYLGA